MSNNREVGFCYPCRNVRNLIIDQQCQENTNGNFFLSLSLSYAICSLPLEAQISTKLIIASLSPTNLFDKKFVKQVLFEVKIEPFVITQIEQTLLIWAPPIRRIGRDS
ncbi:hypothetical protein BpHYR1_042929 [Brachionus plicatilis]|uniref:Uncharacterized protein n=1 Tax=Brachionus plicatilis TaxID=10195 RepID=A0A3M7SVV1_BRAPC|nr:hypothetical protein BpHYR1_042929 [Brachionus plicatilis]